MAEASYAFIKNSEVVNIAVFDDPSESLLAHFKAELSLDKILPATEKAVVGGTWDGTLFWSKQPYPSWFKNETTGEWDCPKAYPKDGAVYAWDEPTSSWLLVPAPTE